MSEGANTHPSQVEVNFRAFQEKLPELLASHAGKLALMKDGTIVEFFDSYGDAIRYGQEKFGEIGNFSIQEVTGRSVSMGFYSYAGYVQ